MVFQSRMRQHVCHFVSTETELTPPSISNFSQSCHSCVAADLHWITELWLPSNTNKTTSECRRQILVVLAWSFEALRNLTKYYIILSNQSSLKLGVCLVISHLHSKRPQGTQEEVKLNIIDWNLFQLPSILCKVVGYIHIKIHGANHFQRYTTQSDLQWLGAG